MCTRNLIQLREFGTEKTFFAPVRSLSEAREQYSTARYEMIKLPCGNCVECRLEHAKVWAFRCVQESKNHENNIMATLTYNDENIPHGMKINSKTGECSESQTLNHEDVQKFLKRLRKAKKGAKIKYYMCGEYGELKDRPHYHIIFFGLKIDDLVPYKTKTTEYGKHILYKSKFMDKIWGKGFVDLNEVNYETCAYVARYVMKKQKGHLSKEIYELRGQVPEYTQMSKGIGKEFYTNNKEKIFNQETIWQKTQNGIQKAKLGRYYDKLMKEDDPDKLEEIKKERKQRSIEIMKEILKQTVLTEDEYIKQKDMINQRKAKELKRS